MSATDLPSDVAPVRPGDELDWPALERYLRAELDGIDGLDADMEVLQFPNGAANLTYLVRFGETPLVVRRPPFGELAPGAHDMRREHRVLSRLWRHYDRAPRAIAFCNDASVIGAPFFVMEYRVGEIIRASVPESMRHHHDLGPRVGFAFVDAVAELHLLDPEACGLGDLGKPVGFVERQVSGWHKRWDLSRPEQGAPGMDDVATLLAASIPTSTRVSVLHNDLHLGNCQFDPEDPDRAKSLFDWDMATVGDPLVDFGGVLAYWRDNDGATNFDPTLVLPSKQAVIERYTERTGFDVEALAWYHAFALWKIAIIKQQLYNRYLRGESNDARLRTFGDAVAESAEQARDLLRAGT